MATKKTATGKKTAVKETAVKKTTKTPGVTIEPQVVRSKRKDEVFIDLNFKLGSETIGRLRLVKNGRITIRHTVRIGRSLQDRIEAFVKKASVKEEPEWMELKGSIAGPFNVPTPAQRDGRYVPGYGRTC